MPNRLVFGLLPLSGPAAAAPLPAPGDATEEPVSDVADRLAAGVPTDVPPQVLYTWTTVDQIERLLQHRMLLTRTESPDNGQTNYALRLSMHAEGTTHPASDLLNQPGFARHRYAWSNPWATALGWEDETYGDALISVELKDEAWMGIFDTQAEQPWRFVDMKGRPVKMADVIANPERVGLVLNLKPQTYEPHPRYFTFGWSSPPYREYVLCNESMIKRWSHGGQPMREVLDDSRDLLTAVRPYLPKHPPAELHSTDIAARWSVPAEDVEALYLHNLALTSQQYWPSKSNIDALIARLASIPDGVAIVHEPDFTFSLESPPPVPGGVP